MIQPKKTETKKMPRERFNYGEGCAFYCPKANTQFILVAPDGESLAAMLKDAWPNMKVNEDMFIPVSVIPSVVLIDE